MEADPGRHLLRSRATGETGRTQSLDVGWNIGGYEVNAILCIAVGFGHEHATTAG